MIERGQEGRNGLKDALEELFDRCDEQTELGSATFSVCLTLMRRLSIDQPIALRQAWATELYQLADTLAEYDRSGSTLNDKQE